MSLSKPSGVVLLLIWCLFMGVTAISIGFGAAFPALNQLAGPVVCSNGQMRVDEQTYRPSPGTTVTTMDWMCVDNKTGEAQPINELSMFLFNGLIYGFVLFGVIMLGYWIAMKRRARRVAERATVNVSDTADFPSGAHATTLDTYELRELTRQYKEGQFSEKEYKRKRKEILDQVAGRIKIEKTSGANTTPHHATASAGTSNKTYEIENDLAQLKKLLDEGLITETDYEQKKTQILSRL